MRLALAFIPVLAACQPTPIPAPVADDPIPWQRAAVNGVECGDNCYLWIGLADPPRSVQALCRSAVCAPWTETGVVPPEWRGEVEVFLGEANQFDAEGNVMSSGFPAVLDMRLPG